MIIRPFQSSDQTAAQTLILDGLADYWGKIDPALNPDLNNIAKSYQSGIFLIAEINKKLVGTGALIPESENIGRIVRMSVDQTVRRQGIGQKILNALIQQAQQRKYTHIVLETTATWQGAIAFYTSFGFNPVGEKDGDMHFELTLT